MSELRHYELPPSCVFIGGPYDGLSVGAAGFPKPLIVPVSSWSRSDLVVYLPDSDRVHVYDYEPDAEGVLRRAVYRGVRE